MRFRILFLITLGSALSARAVDQRTKTILIDRPLGHDPVRVEKVMYGETELQSDGREYPNKYVWESASYAGDDWLGGLSLVVRNVSKKNIVYVDVSCDLYETPEWQEPRASPRRTPLPGQVSNRVGRRPEAALYSALTGLKRPPDTDRPSFELAPGQELSLTLKNKEESSIDDRLPMSNITACSGGLSRIFFEDGTQWQGHRYLRPDLNRPGHWIAMSFEEWSGKPSAKE